MGGRGRGLVQGAKQHCATGVVGRGKGQCLIYQRQLCKVFLVAELFPESSGKVNILPLREAASR